MLKWQVDEVRKTLGLSKLKKSKSTLALNFSYHAEIDIETLQAPMNMLTTLSDKLFNEVQHMKDIVIGILESPTKGAWLVKRKQLIKE